ncbi:MAG: hypothetical protein WCO56_19255 [Verrucomicrobiota bacterium]
MALTNSALIVPASPVSTVTTNELLPIRPPVFIPTGWEWLWWTLGTLAVLAALGVGGYYFYRWLTKRAETPPPVEPPHVRAKRRLEAALRYLSDPRQFCSAVSDALRVYLEERFQLRAPERTTEEFLQDLQRTEVLTKAQKECLTDFLQQCDLVKFARFEPTELTLRELLETALRLVDETAYEAVSTPAVPANPPPPPLPTTPSS